MPLGEVSDTGIGDEGMNATPTTTWRDIRGRVNAGRNGNGMRSADTGPDG